MTREGVISPPFFPTLCCKTMCPSLQNQAARYSQNLSGFITLTVPKWSPKRKSLSRVTVKANAVRSKVRARVEYVFAQQKGRMRLFIRTIGTARAQATIALANMAFNVKRHCLRYKLGKSAWSICTPPHRSAATAMSGRTLKRLHRRFAPANFFRPH